MGDDGTTLSLQEALIMQLDEVNRPVVVRADTQEGYHEICVKPTLLWLIRVVKNSWLHDSAILSSLPAVPILDQEHEEYVIE